MLVNCTFLLPIVLQNCHWAMLLYFCELPHKLSFRSTCFVHFFLVSLKAQLSNALYAPSASSSLCKFKMQTYNKVSCNRKKFTRPTTWFSKCSCLLVIRSLQEFIRVLLILFAGANVNGLSRNIIITRNTLLQLLTVAIDCRRFVITSKMVEDHRMMPLILTQNFFDCTKQTLAFNINFSA